MKIGPLNFGYLDLLLAFVPVSIGLEVFHASPTAIFICSCIAVIPLAGWMGKATEHLASHYGAGIGGLLNATFGNAAEFIIAVFALKNGLFVLVKASLVGSIIGNTLLVLGLSLLVGGLKHSRQTFNTTATRLGTTLLALSAIALVVPAIFHHVADESAAAHAADLSLAIAVVLFITYILSLVFSLKTHSHLFAGDDAHAHDGEQWSKGKAVLILGIATAVIALMSEFLVGSVGHTASTMGMSEVFIGVILVAIIGNAAEHSSAIVMAARNKMDLSINIAVGSGIQIALLIAPALVFLSYAFDADRPLDLLFGPFEVITLVFSVIVVGFVAHDGESHWMEGVLLLAVYIIVGLAFFFL